VMIQPERLQAHVLTFKGERMNVHKVPSLKSQVPSRAAVF
jgi:hypothetical protein